MTRNRLLLFVLPLLFFSFDFRKNEPGESAKWVSLFNGKNLDGWTIKISGYKQGENFGNTFRVQDGILSIRYDQYDSFRNKFGALYYNKKLANYRLKVEYRFVGETTLGAPSWGFRDSGVQYHGQGPEALGLNQPFPVCLEYNLHGGNGKDERPVGEICTSGTIIEINGKPNTSFCTPASVQRNFRGDQWVTLEIDVKGNKIKHFVNGEEILAFENPKYNPQHELGKTLIKGNNAALKEGYVSLQSNSHPIDFRKIELLEY